MNRLSDWLYQASSARVALISLAIFVIFMAAVLPTQAADSERYASEAGSPDLSFFYTKEDLYRMAEAYGESGRQAYVQSRLTFDFFWPIAYALFFSTTISWLFMRGLSPEGLIRRLNITPLLGAIFDYLENVGASLVMTRYPETTQLVDTLTPLFTLTKWILVGGSVVLLLAGIVIAAARGVRSP
jgi:hypothetical protein